MKSFFTSDPTFFQNIQPDTRYQIKAMIIIIFGTLSVNDIIKNYNFSFFLNIWLMEGRPTFWSSCYKLRLSKVELAMLLESVNLLANYLESEKMGADKIL